MSLVDAPELLAPAALPLEPSTTEALLPSHSNASHTHINALHAHNDARALVRLFQCSQCSLPLRTPITLPCGNSICRQCLPPAHVREHISYPAMPSRQAGITCPFSDCGDEHPLVDCSVDVTLLKVMEGLAEEVVRQRISEGETKTHLEENMAFARPDENGDELLEKAHSQILTGGRLISTYTFAEMGELHYTSDVTYPVQGHDVIALDATALDAIRLGISDKIDCQVCYSMLLDPVTTLCGHTFCRKCLVRILDHSRLCPHCRRQLGLPVNLVGQTSNLALGKMISTLFAEELAARIEVANIEESGASGGLDTPLFVCTVAYPSMPIILHVFEPRYRLMIRRALAKNRQFGMLSYNERAQPQGQLGISQFLEYGTMLHIEQFQMEPDGRSWLLCRGLYRFKVQAHGTLDGYVIGRIQRHEDIPLADEERLEAEETAAEYMTGESDTLAQVDHLPTSELLEQILAFLHRAQAQSARWLQGSIQNMYGPSPTDAASLPYWFASVVPLPESEKYKLLPTQSVRERLKVTMRWIRKIEAQRWSLRRTIRTPITVVLLGYAIGIFGFYLLTKGFSLRDYLGKEAMSA